MASFYPHIQEIGITILIKPKLNQVNLHWPTAVLSRLRQGHNIHALVAPDGRDSRDLMENTVCEAFNPQTGTLLVRPSGKFLYIVQETLHWL